MPSKNTKQKPGVPSVPGFLFFMLVSLAIVPVAHLLTSAYAQNGIQVLYPAQSLPLASQEIANRINGIRARHILLPLARDSRMDAMAKRRVVDMLGKGYFGHVSPSGLDLEALARSSGIRYRTVGEILWEGDGIDPSKAAAAAVQSWMDSSSHREEMLFRNYDAMGVSVLRENDRILAAVEFIAYR